MRESARSDDDRAELAVACRVMAHRAIAEDVLGHVSLRVDERHILIRCRGADEAGLRFTLPADIRLVDVETGAVVDDPDGGYEPPGELPIHTAILAARDDVHAVVHAHPPDVVVATLTDTPLPAMFGAYNIPAMRLALDGIASYPRSHLIRTRDAGRDLVAALGDANAAVLLGHGVVTAGRSVPEAVLRALHVDTLARMALAVRRAGATPQQISDADIAELPDLGERFNVNTLWRHHVAALVADGRGLADDRSRTREEHE